MIFYTINPILIAAAVVPAIFLIIRIYKMDKLEHEPTDMIVKLVFLGAVSTLIAIAGETVGEMVLGMFFPEDAEQTSILYNAILYFVIVGISEEGGKYLVLKKSTWNNPNFNCKFDGIVYAVTVSLGFALWENIKYVAAYGLMTALVRAVTAVPGHASFGVIMGLYYGMARKAENLGQTYASNKYRKLAVIVPCLIHGAYDFIATLEEISEDTTLANIIFIVFVVAMMAIAYFTARKSAKNDEFI